MRVALVITELDVGGAEKCLTELALFLRREGVEVLVIGLGPAPIAPRDTLHRRLEAAGVPVQFLAAEGSRDFFRSVRELRSELKRFAPDIVQSMLWHANVVSSWALRNQDVPLVGGVRVSEPRMLRHWIERNAAKRMARIVCVSDDVADYCKTRTGIPAEKLIVIPNGVELPEASSAPRDWRELGVKTDGPVLLFVGRLEEQKNVRALIQHADAILTPNPTASLVLIGDGSLRAELESKRRQARSADRIVLAGWRADSREWMAGARVVLLPAVYEGMPNVLLESMSVATPFVAFEVDGVKQLTQGLALAEAIESQTVDSGDWNSFISSVNRFATDADLARKVGRSNRDHVASRFRLDKQLTRYLDLYRSLQ